MYVIGVKLFFKYYLSRVSLKGVYGLLFELKKRRK